MFLRFFGYFFGIGTALFVIGSAIAGYFIYRYSVDLPDYTVLREYQPPIMTRIHAGDGQLVAEYARERRLYLPIQAIPDLLKNAFISAEDKNFYSHAGIDFQGIGRAILVNIQNMGTNRRPIGASTITQQVAKNFLLSNEATIDRKIREALISLRIERAFTKEKILELYLNEIYLGMGAYGVAAASLLYFDKSVHELTLAEAAYLAALPKAPNNYHPFRFPERAIERRNWVLDRMLENGYIDEDAAMQAKNQPLKVTPRRTGVHLFASDYFVEEVRRQLLSMYGEEKLYSGGLSVRTTLDPEMQKMARTALINGLIRYDTRRGWRGPVTTIDIGGDWGAALARVRRLQDVPEWQLAVVLSTAKKSAEIGLRPGRDIAGKLLDERKTAVIPFKHMKWARRWAVGERKGRAVKSVDRILSPGDVVYVERVSGEQSDDGHPVYRLRQVPKISGAIVAMDPHTGRVLALVGGFSFSQSQFNRATQAMRQPGSAFKPFIYAAALDNGYTPSSVIVDQPIALPMGNGRVWRPKNYGGKFYGPSTLRLGIERSRNVMTVQLARDMGMPLIVEYARRFGIYDDLMPVLSMALGAGETTVLRLTGAYATIANGGRRIYPTLIDRIQDRSGKTIYKHDKRICKGCEADAWRGQDEPELIDEREQVLDPMTAYQITSMMEGVVQRGTATIVKQVGRPLAGKTGTTNDEKDAWFVGFSPDLVAGVFMGFDKPASMGRGATGGQLAAPVFRDFMKAALADKPPVPFRVPAGIKLIPIDRKTGQRARPGSPGVIMEAFKPGTDPSDAYSIIEYNGGLSDAGTVTPEADRAIISGTGGFY